MGMMEYIKYKCTLKLTENKYSITRAEVNTVKQINLYFFMQKGNIKQGDQKGKIWEIVWCLVG